MKHLLFTFIFSVTFNMFAYSQDIKLEEDYMVEAWLKIEEKKYEDAIAIYMESLDIGYLECGYIFEHLGNCYLKMNKFDDAYLWFTKGAEFSIPDCMFALGGMCMKGQGMAVDTLQALSWYIRGIDINATKITSFEKIIKGTSLERDQNVLCLIDKYRKAATLYDQYKKAEKANEDEKAFNYAKQGAELGIGYFVCKLGMCYELGQGVKINHSKAYSLFQQAIAMGYTDSYVFRLLGFSCYGLNRVNECLEAWETSARYGDHISAQYLGHLYCGGKFFKPDYDLASYYYKKAAILSGDPSSMDERIAEMKRKSSQSVNYVAEKPKQKKSFNVIGAVLSAFVQGANQYLGQSYSVPTNNYMLVTPSYTNTMPSFETFTQQLQNEYQQTKQAIPGLTYTQFLEARGRAINNMSSTYEGNSGSYGNTSSGSSGYHSESNNSSHNKCMSCEVPGNGVCKSCHGSGLVNGMGLNRIPCPNCKNNVGKCGWCGGTGKRY